MTSVKYDGMTKFSMFRALMDLRSGCQDRCGGKSLHLPSMAIPSRAETLRFASGDETKQASKKNL